MSDEVEGNDISTLDQSDTRHRCETNRERTVGREQEVGRILPFTPFDSVDLLLNLQRFEIVKLGLVRLAARANKFRAIANRFRWGGLT